MPNVDVIEINGIGDSSKKLLSKLNIETVDDLINNVPRRYDDFSNVTNVRSIRPGQVTLKVKIGSIVKRYSKKGLHITEALATDETGNVRIMWFNQPYRANSIKPEEFYYISGEYASSYKYLVITNPVCELVSNFPIHTARLVPNYKLTKGITSNQLRRYTKLAFDKYPPKETLPEWLVKKRDLIDRPTALFSMHFPKTLETLNVAKKRIGFDEIFEMSLASALNKLEFAKQSSVNIKFSEKIVKDFVTSLPFKLTDDQRKSAWEIIKDTESGHPMNRLLEGDVGSGKTVVSAIAIINAISSGFQTAILAPTEILATQHAETLRNILPINIISKIVYLSGSMTKKQKELAYNSIKSGQAKIIVGTHALFQVNVEYNNLGLAVIDEQHRFGVKQRKALQGKAKILPHILNMTATPIPRSLMLTLYGEMDISTLKQKPIGRKPIHTIVLQPENRQKLYESLKTQIKAGNQLFVICPLIDAEDKIQRSLSVKSIHKQLSSWYKEFNVGLLHGKLKSDEKDKVMLDFKSKKYDVLVSTTVIEVGVDVPNANLMIIEGADKFGLAQLHQLRGRIGRNEIQANCYLVTTENKQPNARLRKLESETDGFKLAEYDLEIRGPGAIYGTMQHGALDLRVAKITEKKLIQEARQSANEFIQIGENLLKYPQLKARVEVLRTITNLN